MEVKETTLECPKKRYKKKKTFMTKEKQNDLNKENIK